MSLRTATFSTLFALLLAPQFSARGDQDDNGQRPKNTPDMLQVDPRLPAGGSFYCGPVALSNGLMRLAKDGRPSLIPDRAGDEQVNMTILLAGNSYLKTYANKGTSTPRLMLGVLKYLNRQRLKGSVSFQGWRTIDRQFRRRLGLTDDDPPALPDLDALKTALGRDDTAIVLDVGFYRKRGDGDVLERGGGHWVTLVGLREADDDADGPTNATLLIHNPDPAAGKEKSTDAVNARPIAAGALTGEFQGLPVKAAGYYRLEGLPMPDGADVAVLDGVVIVTVQKAQ